MSIWKTSIPTARDYPIWAFTDSDIEVVLIRSPEPGDASEPITWCRADVPPPPKDHIRRKYEVLADSSVSEVWCSYDWFKAGCNYGKHSRDISSADEDSDIREPYESAYDERV